MWESGRPPSQGHPDFLGADGSDAALRCVFVDAIEWNRSPIELEPCLRLEDQGPEVCLRIGDYELDFRWGQPHLLGTAAFWVDQTRQRTPCPDYRLGESLAEEVVACLLGGFGVLAEIGFAAFDAVRSEGLVSVSPPPSSQQIEAVLCQPLPVRGYRQPIRYRYPRQRAYRISSALAFLAQNHPPDFPTELRDWLRQIPGIGPKTASWIVRNYTATDCVAIIDIHVRRAGLAAGFFDPRWRLPQDYDLFEGSLLSVALLGDVSAAALDACIWGQLHFLGRASSAVLGMI